MFDFLRKPVAVPEAKASAVGPLTAGGVGRMAVRRASARSCRGQKHQGTRDIRKLAAHYTGEMRQNERGGGNRSAARCDGRPAARVGDCCHT